MHATLFIDHEVLDPEVSLPFELLFLCNYWSPTQSHDSKLPWLIPFFQYRKFALKAICPAQYLAFQFLFRTFLLTDFRN